MINLQSVNSAIASLTVTATIDTALCVGAGGSSGSLADKPIVRTADGKLLIPASQFKGRLRHECEKLARSLGWNICESPKAETMCPQRAGFSREEQERIHHQYPADENKHHHCLICQIFGNPSLHSRIDFDDLICPIDAENLPEVLRPGVTINRRRRVAEDQKLYFLETSPANLQLPFQGDIHFYPDVTPQAKLLIFAALHHIVALGGSKSAGLGWLTWQINPPKISQTEWQKLIPGGVA
jgi:CRISPR/Cas system CSM-associated protein Csm3 (group 7 of RAMP superfamily)